MKSNPGQLEKYLNSISISIFVCRGSIYSCAGAWFVVRCTEGMGLRPGV
jgi:hypothetical protein